MKIYSLFLILVLQFCKAGGDHRSKSAKKSVLVKKQMIKNTSKQSSEQLKNYKLLKENYEMLKKEHESLKKKDEFLEEHYFKSIKKYLMEEKKQLDHRLKLRSKKCANLT